MTNINPPKRANHVTIQRLPKQIQAFDKHLIDDIRPVIRALGYNCIKYGNGLDNCTPPHTGSRKDLDVMCIPWVKDAPPYTVILNYMNSVRKWHWRSSIEVKPFKRLACSYMYVDDARTFSRIVDFQLIGTVPIITDTM